MTTQETPKQVLDKLGRFIDQQETARASAQALANQLERELDRYRQTLERHKASYLAQIEALILALDEVAADYTELERAARVVVDSAARELNYRPDVLLVSTAALRALGARVSSTNARSDSAPIEETRAGDAAARGGEGG